MKEAKQTALRAALALAAGALMITGSGCGRTLPAIDAETLAQKKAVLVLADDSLTGEETAQIEKAASEKAAADHISLEFVAKTSTNPDALSSTIRANHYDSVIAAGNGLVAPLAELAQKEPKLHFVLLGNGLSAPSGSPAASGNTYIKKLDESGKNTVWNDWVQLQKASGMNVLWVSRTDAPVPSEWVPSEEADKLLQLDIYPGDTWFPQLTYQAAAAKANIIALYTPVDEAILNKIRSLKLPVTDTVQGLKAQYNWQNIIQSSISRSLSADWKGGEEYYSAEEAGIIRK